MRVDACEPLFPPVEMHRGMNRLSTTTAAMASSKKVRTVNVPNSATNSRLSQNARLRHSLKKLAPR